MTIIQEAQKLQSDSEYIELFIFDASYIGGTTYYVTNTPVGSDPILWRGNLYYSLPFELHGIGRKGDGTAPNRPTITISNVTKFLMAAVVQLGDLVGTQVTRYRTFYKFTDNGSTPDINATFEPDQWIITKKLPSTIKSVIQFEMSNCLDRPGLKLPKRQILKDGLPGTAFPGVARNRLR